MRYEEHEMKCIQFDETEVFTWVVESGEDGRVQSVNPGSSDK